MKKFSLIALLLLAGTSFGQNGLGEVVGTVINAKTKENIYSANVFILDQDRRYITRTDEDGRFRLSAVPSGTYQLYISYFSDTMISEIVDIPMDGFARTGIIEFRSKTQEFDAIVVDPHSKGLKIVDGFLPIPKLEAKEIAKSAIKFDLKALVTSTSPGVQLTDDGSLVFRGARKGDMIYIVDGMKSTGDIAIPSTAISKMMVYSGGLPANYGDTMGGAVVIETKSYFELLRNYESAQLRMGN
ncbi:MAG: carboxypeptidase regulatory-like domain-containing protein [Crocinitomicaceae bacterium]